MADLSLLWHMHQPDYRHPVDGHFTRPWALLHGIKDYADMASHLERHPGVRCTVNFVPVLLDQLEDYAVQLATGQWRDTLLRCLAAPEPDTLPESERSWLRDIAFRCHAPTMLEPFAPFRRLRDLMRTVQDQDGHGLSYLSGHYYADLATWCLLAWSGESLRREGGIVATLMAKGAGFDLGDRRALLAELARVVKGLVPRYRALAERGQIELSCSPAQHPLAPLLLDFHAAREALPDCALPSAPAYPGGRSRVTEHMLAAQHSHRQRFGRASAGLWPAEGALSAPFLQQIAQAGFAWTASSQAVLRHCAGNRADTSVPWQAPEDCAGDITVFFRDDHLSDLIGFEYARWHARDAAQHFIHEVSTLHQRQPRGLAPVFLDGENAWEYYPYNAWYFFDDLYDALERHADIRTVTLSEACATHRDQRRRLPRMVAGSWVGGTLATWIGSPAKNHAWELLCEVKHSVDRTLCSDRLSAERRAAIAHRLAVCETSDWFWWLGDENPAESVAYFDEMFRENIKALYQLLELPAPASLAHPLPRGGGAHDTGGAMRRAN